MSIADDGVDLDPGRLEAALAGANIPCLVPLLVQLTGDRRWTREPYRPTRPRGTDDHDDGGLPADVQRQIRDATAEAVLAWAAGRSAAIPAPTGDQLLELLSLSVAEDVPSDYEAMAAEEMGFRPRPERAVRAEPVEGVHVLIVGAGISGMTAAKHLRDLGVAHTVLEKNPTVGGTWTENRYPGCGVDTPSYLYSLSFYPRAWSSWFGKRDELEDYLESLADHFDLRRNIRFSTTVERADWDDSAQRWVVTVTASDGGRETLTGHVLISAVGQLNIPKEPDLPGGDSFDGPVFHSARWPADLDVSGKRVAVVGTGASAMQIVPAIADRVAALDVYQRSPQWIMPNAKYFASVDPDVHWLMEHVPFYRSWYRFRLAWAYNDRIHDSLQKDPSWPHPDRSLNAVNDAHRRMFTDYITSELDGRPDLLEKALPTYPPFGKRMLQDNGWFTALKKPNVQVITAGVAELCPGGVTDDRGETRPADVVVLATGFRTSSPVGFPVAGRDGRLLREVWGEDDARAYLGITMPGFPNLFFMYGPNTNLGHGGSFIYLAESQITYIVDAISAMVDGGLASIECRPEIFEGYNRELDAAHERMIWTHPGMDTYYRNAAGRVVSTMPWRVVDYWTMTRHIQLDDFIVRTNARPAAPRQEVSA
jgi:4-hydroxyacetophenone monooxygenase